MLFESDQCEGAVCQVGQLFLQLPEKVCPLSYRELI